MFEIVWSTGFVINLIINGAIGYYIGNEMRKESDAKKENTSILCLLMAVLWYRILLIPINMVLAMFGLGGL